MLQRNMVKCKCHRLKYLVLYYKRVVALIVKIIVPLSISYCTLKFVQCDILLGTIFLNICAIFLIHSEMLCFLCIIDVITYIKFYSLFIKSFTIHRTIKVPVTFKFFTISQPCNKSHIVYCYMVYQSYILLNLWQVLFSPGKLVPPHEINHINSIFYFQRHGCKEAL